MTWSAGRGPGPARASRRPAPAAARAAGFSRCRGLCDRASVRSGPDRNQGGPSYATHRFCGSDPGLCAGARRLQQQRHARRKRKRRHGRQRREQQHGREQRRQGRRRGVGRLRRRRQQRLGGRAQQQDRIAARGHRPLLPAPARRRAGAEPGQPVQADRGERGHLQRLRLRRHHQGRQRRRLRHGVQRLDGQGAARHGRAPGRHVAEPDRRHQELRHRPRGDRRRGGGRHRHARRGPGQDLRHRQEGGRGRRGPHPGLTPLLPTARPRPPPSRSGIGGRTTRCRPATSRAAG
ncbi:putative Fructose-1,6-bisphosphatase, GlpX type [Actinacidiphila bryophytorum]|uniref:Fructose-1,6-bisphosphatase, GlpX type n=1 Tax=Actinacidiphila bryophytorum TaxID=1436133 RepID=A0A9W4E898_9ACTN|nr:putative Fructose-1,6-bisphosphatase, GlpX type [Actinacidiphila bryophytorum]